MDFNKNDVRVLDFILDKVIENGQSSYDDFLNINLNLEKKEFEAPLIDEEKFESYFYVFEENNIGEIHRLKEATYIKKTIKTQSFKDNGGFMSLFNEKIKEKEFKNIERRSREVNLELAEKTLKEFPKTKWFARIGFGIAVILALKELIMIFIVRN